MPSFLTTRRLTLAAAGALALSGAACKDPTSVPELNNIPSSVIEGNLTATTTRLLTLGLINRDRDIASFRYIVFAETLARDVYNIDPSESRFITQLLGNVIDPAGFIGQSGGYTEAFNAVRAADLLISKIGTASDLTAEQQSGVKGIAYTFKALALYRALELRGTYGIPVVNVDPGVSGAALVSGAPIKCEASALATISATLDTGATALASAGTSFLSGLLPAGFTSNGNFNTPAAFLQFNRGLKGRAEFYRGLRTGDATAFTNAITALNASFLDTTAPTTNGVYFTFASAPDTFNPLAVPTIALNPTITTAAAGAGAFGQSQVLQAGDARGAAKVAVGATRTRSGVTTNLFSPIATATPSNLVRPIPLLRNAELILLRAQAEIELGQFQAATDDMNVVRVKEGGLAPYALTTDKATAIQRVLYEKRFSLLLEGAQRLVDLRTYGLLNTANLGASPRAADVYNQQLPTPQFELDQRQQTLTQAVCTN